MALAVAITLLSALRPLGDVDAFWHLLIGYDILEHGRFTGDPQWLHSPPRDWVTTQWASEVTFAALHALFGWHGLIVFNVAIASILLTLLRHILVATTGTPLGARLGTALTFTAIAVGLSINLQERPSMISYAFLLWLAHWTWQAASTGRWPRWWAITLFTLVWAQFHGYWVMVPVAITACAALRLAQSGIRSELRRPVALAALTSVAGGLSPAGVYGYTAPIHFRAAGSGFIAEWQHPDPLAPTTIVALSVLVVAVVTAWQQPTRRAALVCLTWVGLLTIFGWSAERNLIPAILLAAPLCASHHPRQPRHPRTATPHHHNSHDHPGTPPATSALLQAAALALLIALPAAAMSNLILHGPFAPHAVPDRLLTHLAQQPGERKVLNDYELGGHVLSMTRPGVKVAIDSRADRYGKDTIHAYLSLMNAGPGWEETLATYAPTDALIETDAPLNARLPALGWQRVAHQGDYTLWTRPHR